MGGRFSALAELKVNSKTRRLEGVNVWSYILRQGMMFMGRRKCLVFREHDSKLCSTWLQEATEEVVEFLGLK